MDPLSVAASCIAVATLAANVGSTLMKLHVGNMQAMRNQVTDLGGVLRHIAFVLRERQRNNITDESLVLLQHLLAQTASKLQEIDCLFLRIIGPPGNPRKSVAKAAIWLKEKGKLLSLQQDLCVLKSNLNMAMGSCNSHDSLRIRLDLQKITVIAEDASAEQASQKTTMRRLSDTHETLGRALFEHHNQVDQRFDKLENMWIKQLSVIQHYRGVMFENSVSRDGLRPEGLTDSYKTKQRDPEMQMLTPRTDHQQKFRFPGVRVQALQYNGPVCKAWCPCDCHTRGRVKTPKFLERIIGEMFIGYAGLPNVNNACNKRYCERRQTPFVTMDYWFPSWWMTYIVKMTFAYQPMAGPQMNMTTLRRVPETAQCFLFAMEGDIEGVKALLVSDKASTRDVASTTGYTMLTWAVIKRQAKMAEFLLNAGSDPYHDPSGIQPTPSDLAWDVWLRGVIPKSNELAIRSLLHHSDFVEDQNFPLVHKIILGLSLRSLDDELGENPQAPFETDAQGRTALSWAACRGDALSCAKLLARGAHANALDKHLKSPLYLAVNSEHITQNDCVRVLLEGGAETDPILHNSGVVRSTPLLCAANEADDILVLKTLIDYGADIEARNRTGATPLLIVARSKPVTFAALLLAYGANVHARDKSGKSVLATCIAHNNHDVLHLLLDRWFRYTACPRLRNVDILHVAAEHADLETMKMLMIAGHWGLHADTQNAQGLTADEMIRKRTDKTPEIARAFARLVRAVQNAPTYADKTRMMEAGLLKPQQADWLRPEQLPDHEELQEEEEKIEDEGDEEDQFEEAVEFLSYV